jgi:uncharacterized protein (TIGR00251 family)
MTTELQARSDESGVVFRVKVTPRASRTQLNGCVEGVLRIKVQAPPVEGAANEAVIRFLAATLDVSKSRVKVIRGETAREKTIKVEGLRVEELKNKLAF